jgi:hypothetical protein
MAKLEKIRTIGRLRDTDEERKIILKQIIESRDIKVRAVLFWVETRFNGGYQRVYF